MKQPSRERLHRFRGPSEDRSDPPDIARIIVDFFIRTLILHRAPGAHS